MGHSIFHQRKWNTCLLNWEKSMIIYIYMITLKYWPITWLMIFLIFISEWSSWSKLTIWYISTCIMIVSHTDKHYRLLHSLLVYSLAAVISPLVKSYIHQAGTVLPSVCPSKNHRPMREDLTGPLGRNSTLKKLNKQARRKQWKKLKTCIA